MILFILFLFFNTFFSNPIFEKNFIEHLKHIAPFEIYSPEENPFRDWTREEIRAMLRTEVPHLEFLQNENINEEITILNDVPDTYDFRKEHPDCLLGIRNQLSCGSCWAFSGTMTFQERLCLHSGGAIKVVLSPQDSISCDKRNNGCNGGFLSRTWQYFVGTGVVDDDCFPYSSGEGDVENCIGTCKNGAEWKKYKCSRYTYYTRPASIKKELVENGPLQVGFDVYSDFMSYKSGIYVHKSGVKEGGHAVVLLGYGNEEGIDYWICQNSWGEHWGESGYFRIKIGECTIDDAGYAGVPALE